MKLDTNPVARSKANETTEGRTMRIEGYSSSGRAYVRVSGERVWADVAQRHGMPVETDAMGKVRAELRHRHETGELPPAWEPEPIEAPEIDDAELDAAMREREAIEAGCIDSDDPCHPGHPITCQRPCCRPAGWEP